MDFDQAIAGHSAWKRELKAYLSNPDGSLHSSDFACEENCTLGQMIRDYKGEGANTPEFAMLKGCHCRLHQIAAALVRRSEFDPTAVKELEMGSNSDFTAAAAALVLALVAMKKRAESGNSLASIRTVVGRN